MIKATGLTYRDAKLPKELQDALRAPRDKDGVTNEEIVEAAVETHLPSALENLRKLGLGFQRGNLASTRLPFSGIAKTLDKLRKASNEVQIPSVQLLELCLYSSTASTSRGVHKREQSNQRGAQIWGENPRGTPTEVELAFVELLLPSLRSKIEGGGVF